MNLEDKRTLAIKIAFRYLGTWYKWGGSTPGGFDCSGLICELLQSVGLIDRKLDYTAQGLQDLFKAPCFCRTCPQEGFLVFYKWSTSDRVEHVELCISDELTIGASNGDRSTLTLADALAKNAFIKIRPIRMAYVVGYADPFARD